MLRSFVISKAAFTKTAINPKFVDRFSLKNFSTAIDQCNIKSPNFVSTENFYSCQNVRQEELIWFSSPRFKQYGIGAKKLSPKTVSS